MSWIGRWFGNWFGRWFGTGEAAEPPQTTTALRFGRIIRASDILFANTQAPTLITSDAVILSRTSADDYVRFRIPDTNCPPLPGPNTPLDSGVADESEPNRWLFSGQYVQTTGWLFGRQSGDALDWVSPSYTCYSGDFNVNVQLVWSDVGLPRSPEDLWSIFDLFIFGIPSANCGIALGHIGEALANQPWGLNVYAYTGGYIGVQIGRLIAGEIGNLRLIRSGSTIYASFVGGNTVQVATNVSGRVQLRLWRRFTPIIPGGGDFIHIPAVTVLNIQTLSGASSTATVTSPVVDMGKPMVSRVERLPEIGTLSWRASNIVFGQTDSLPEWNNPEGEFRYWQARVTWAERDRLVERIQFIRERLKHIFTIRHIARNIEIWHVIGRYKRGTEKGVVSIDRASDRDYHELGSESERIVTIDR